MICSPVKMRHRTLDDFPMQHGVADAVGMLERRRQEQQSHKRSMTDVRHESKSLSSYSRRRFDAALSARRGEQTPAPPTADVESPLFYREPQPTWQRPRLSVASYAGRDDKPPHPLSARPDSEPPLWSWAGKTFDHTRGRPEAYPGIRQLVKGYNSGMKVVCRGSSNCAEAWETGRVSVGSDVLLLPLVEPAVEEEERVMSRLSLHDDEEEQEVEHLGDTKISRVLHSGMSMPPSARSISMPLSEKDAASKSSENQGSEEDTASSANSICHVPSSPWRCWVDTATVSSVNLKPEDPPLSTCHSPPPVISPPMTPMTPASEIPPPSPAPMLKKRGSVVSKKKGKKELEPEVAEPPPPPPPIIEEVKEEEVVGEVELVAEAEPVLPASICPSSNMKAHEAEVKLWLRKSSFTAARRAAPMFWS